MANPNKACGYDGCYTLYKSGAATAMTTAAQTTLLHAAELLEADAKAWSWRECNDDEHIRRGDLLCTARELRLLAIKGE